MPSGLRGLLVGFVLFLGIARAIAGDWTVLALLGAYLAWRSQLPAERSDWRVKLVWGALLFGGMLLILFCATVRVCPASGCK